MLSTGTSSHHKKFNLLFTEEGEQYIQDFFGKIRYFDVHSKVYRTQQAIIHFCSRSVVIEFNKDPSQPLYKYLLKFFSKEPFFNQHIDRLDKNNMPLAIYCNRLVEVPIQSVVPRPYIIHEAKKTEDLPNNEFEL